MQNFINVVYNKGDCLSSNTNTVLQKRELPWITWCFPNILCFCCCEPLQYSVYILQFHFYHILYYILGNLYLPVSWLIPEGDRLIEVWLYFYRLTNKEQRTTPNTPSYFNPIQTTPDYIKLHLTTWASRKSFASYDLKV